MIITLNLKEGYLQEQWEQQVLQNNPSGYYTETKSSRSFFLPIQYTPNNPAMLERRLVNLKAYRDGKRFADKRDTYFLIK